jgi:hypothetical protein
MDCGFDALRRVTAAEVDFGGCYAHTAAAATAARLAAAATGAAAHGARNRPDRIRCLLQIVDNLHPTP